MGSHISLNVDINHAISLYESGKSITQIAKELGVGSSTISRRFSQAGYRTLRSNAEIGWLTAQRRYGDISEAIRMYVSGSTLEDARKSIGVPRRFLEKAIVKAGHTLRTQAQQLGLRYTRMSVSERRSITAQANIALRGKKASPKRMERRARTNENTLQLASRADLILALWLVQRGVQIIPQKAVGPYNIDIAVEHLFVAIEVNGHWRHFSSSNAAAIIQRKKYLRDRGWVLIEVRLTSTHDRPWKYLRPLCADKIITLLDRISRGETLTSEETVLGGDGELFTGS